MSEQTSPPLAIEESTSVDGVGGSISVSALEIDQIGGERYALAGPVELGIEEDLFGGSLSAATWLRVEEEVDGEGRRRVDGLLDLQLDGSGALLVRIAGFADGEMGALRVAGLFRADANALGVVGSGSFSGSMALNGSSGTVVLTLTP